MIRRGDCLNVMAAMDAGSVDLIYLDPPFNSGRDYKAASGGFSDRFASTADYVHFITERLIACKRIMSERASIYVHVDDTACHRVRCAMDDVFGEKQYRAQITWKRTNPQTIVTKKWCRISDIIFHYAGNSFCFNPQYIPLPKESLDYMYRYDDNDGRGKYSIWYTLAAKNPKYGHFYKWKDCKTPPNGWSIPISEMEKLDLEKRIHYPKRKDGTRKPNTTCKKKFYLSQCRGQVVGNIWDDISPLKGHVKENSFYPTQKPLALLERIISASSNEGDLVFDPFMGSGTTLVAAKRLGRRYAGCDISQDAVNVTRERLERELV